MKKEIVRFKKIMLAFFMMLFFVFGASAQNGKTAVSLFNKAHQMQLREDYYSAIESYREALQLNPQYGDAWYNLALCTFKTRLPVTRAI